MKLSRMAPVAACALLLGAATSAIAFPDEPVTMIVPFPPGGSSDQAARPLATALERHWDQPVVVSNKPGAGSALGMTAAANAEPDGHTVTIANPAYTLLPATDRVLERDPSFDPDALVPVARIAADPLVIIVQNDAPWQTFEEFLEDAKKRPREVSYASSGTYGAAHVPFEMMADAAGIELNHVAYQGGGPSITALLGGHVDATASGPAVVKPLIDGGEARALVQTGAERVDLLPDVPTLSELGIDVEYYLWSGLFTSAEVPEETLAQLRGDVKAAMEDPQYIEDMATIGVPIQYLDGDAFAERLAEDAQRIEAAVQKIGKIE